MPSTAGLTLYTAIHRSCWQTVQAEMHTRHDAAQLQQLRHAEQQLADALDADRSTLAARVEEFTQSQRVRRAAHYSKSHVTQWPAGKRVHPCWCVFCRLSSPVQVWYGSSWTPARTP